MYTNSTLYHLRRRLSRQILEIDEVITDTSLSTGTSKTEPANPRNWRSHHRRLVIDGNITYNWKHNVVKFPEKLDLMGSRTQDLRWPGYRRFSRICACNKLWLQFNYMIWRHITIYEFWWTQLIFLVASCHCLPRYFPTTPISTREDHKQVYPWMRFIFYFY